MYKSNFRGQRPQAMTSDEESIQFVDHSEDGTESIQFDDDLAATTRSHRSVSMVGQQRSRAPSMRQQMQKLQQQFPQAPHNTTHDSRARGVPTITSAESVDDTESVAFFEDNGSMVSSVAPGGWFLGKGVSPSGTPAGSSAGSPKILQASTVSGGAAARIATRRGSMSSRPRSVTTVVTSDDEPLDSLAALDKRLAKIAQKAASSTPSNNNLSFTNRSIQFTLDEDADEGKQGEEVDGGSLVPPSSRNDALSVEGKQQTENQAKKTVVSTVLRQRGASMTSLRRSSVVAKNGGSRGAAHTTTPTSRPTATQVVAAPPQSDEGEYGVDATCPPKERRQTLMPTQHQQQLTTIPPELAPQGAIISPAATEFPSYAPGRTVDSGVQARVAGEVKVNSPAAAAAASQRHQRTDSSHIVLEHLKEQEASNIFVQHKALMLGSPQLPASLAPYVTEVVGAHSSGSTASSSRRDPPAPASMAIKDQHGSSKDRRRATSGHPVTASRIVGHTRAASSGGGSAVRQAAETSVPQEGSLLLLAEAQRLTEQVRRFNAKQQRELVDLDERLHTALLNRTVTTATSARSVTSGTTLARNVGMTKQPLTDAPQAASNRQTFQETAALLRQVADAAGIGGANGLQRERATSNQRSTVVTQRSTYQRLQSTAGKGRSSSIMQNVPPTPNSNNHGPSQVVKALGSTAPASSKPDTNTTSTAKASASSSASLETVARQVASSMNVIAPTLDELRQLTTSTTTERPAGVQLFFRTGVKLSDVQVQQFVSLVRVQFRGHTLHDSHIQAVAMQQLSPRDASILRRSAADAQQQMRSAAAAESQGGYSGGGAKVTTKASSSSNNLKGTGKKHTRTEIVRSLFDLLDVEGKGCITRPELPMLMTLVLEECTSESVDDAEYDRAKLLRSSALHQAAFDGAFSPTRRPTRPAPTVHGSTSYASRGSEIISTLQHGRFHCEDAHGFVLYCRLAAYGVLPLLEQSLLDVWEFPHVGMLVSAALQSPATGGSPGPHHRGKGSAQRTLAALVAALQ